MIVPWPPLTKKLSLNFFFKKVDFFPLSNSKVTTEASRLVLDFKISASGSSCHFLFVGLILSSFVCLFLYFLASHPFLGVSIIKSESKKAKMRSKMWKLHAIHTQKQKKSGLLDSRLVVFSLLCTYCILILHQWYTITIGWLNLIPSCITCRRFLILRSENASWLVHLTAIFML